MAKDMAKDYTATLNLPNTSFSMRANLPQREPETIKYWDSIDLYGMMQKAGEGKPLFVLHDGPPFSNGNIHMGTSMNKILKDMIVIRSHKVFTSREHSDVVHQRCRISQSTTSVGSEDDLLYRHVLQCKSWRNTELRLTV